MIPTFGKDRLLLSYPPLCRFNVTTAAKARFTRLVNVLVMGAVSMAASLLFRASGDVFNVAGSSPPVSCIVLSKPLAKMTG